MILRFCFCWVVAAAGATTAQEMPAQPAEAAAPAIEPAADEPAPPDAHPFDFPTTTNAWLNFAPLSLDRLYGKGIVLYFFDAQNATCAGKWPALLELSEKYAAEPVLFIGVSSGTSPQQLASYVAQHRIVWPIIVDADRSFERLALGNVIDQDNPYQIRIRAGSGKWEDQLRTQMPAAVKAACEGAVYRVAPANVPAALRPAWGLVELGDYASAQPLLAAAAARDNPESTAAVAALRDVVAVDMQAEVHRIERSLAADDHWRAYQQLTAFLATYAAYDYPEKFDQAYRDLRRSDAVENEQQAAERLQRTIRIGSAGTPAAIKRGTRMLEQLVEKHPGTRAAAEARAMLDRLAQLRAAGDQPAIAVEWRSAGFRPAGTK